MKSLTIPTTTLFSLLLLHSEAINPSQLSIHQCPCLLHISGTLPPDAQIAVSHHHQQSSLATTQTIIPHHRLASSSRPQNRNPIRLPHHSNTSVSLLSQHRSDVSLTLVSDTQMLQPNFSCPVVLEQPKASSDSGSPRIFGGVQALRNTSRYMVSISTSINQFVCSGVLLSARWVLTAAHCRATEEDIIRIFTLNASRGFVRRVKAVFNNELYTGEFIEEEGDIALIELEKDAPAGATFVRINADANMPLPGSFSRISGYGLKQDDDVENVSLRQIDLPVVNFEKCRRLLSFIAALEDESLHFCAGYDQEFCQGDSCSGDSGGPAVQFDADNHPVVVGLVSFGYECGLRGLPGVYLRVSSYIEWMRSSGAVFNTSTSIVPQFGVGSAEAAAGLLGVSPDPESEVESNIGVSPDPDGEVESNSVVEDKDSSFSIPVAVFVVILVVLGICVLGLIVLGVMVVKARRQDQAATGAASNVETVAGEAGSV